MKLYAIVDENLTIARNMNKGTKGVFVDLKMLKRHAWRYQQPNKTYKIAVYHFDSVYEFEELEG